MKLHINTLKRHLKNTDIALAKILKFAKNKGIMFLLVFLRLRPKERVIMANKIAKPEHAYKSFGQDLKTNNFEPVLFLYGIEQYLVEWAAASLKKKYVNPAALSFDFTKIDDENAGIDEIITSCETFPMFSEKRIVWVKNHALLRSQNPKGFSEQDKKALLDYAENPSEETILIISTDADGQKNDFFKELKKKSKAYDFDRLDRVQISAFAEKRFRACGLGIKREALRYLIEETGYFNKESEYRIFNLENDIKKVIAHCDGAEVKPEDISTALNGDMDTYIFNFLDAAANKKKDAAFTIMHSMLNSGSDFFSIVPMLINQFELLLEVKEFKDDAMPASEIIKIMKIHEFRVKKAMQTSDRFTKTKLREILSQLYELDRNVKTGTLEQNLALELFVGRI